MINIIEQSGNTSYGVVTYVLDSIADLENLPKNVAPGSAALIISTSDIYMLNG
jgi:hypothetical protein